MAGRVIIFPTDTVYGIGTQIKDLEGIEKIYQIKHRPKDKPLACLCANLEQIESIAYVTDDARALIKEFLPGGLTLILKTKEEIQNVIGYPTIGVRIPNHETAIKILEENGPMLTTSVNESGCVPLNEYDEIYKEYHTLVDKIYTNDRDSLNLASTVVLLTTDNAKILRVGPIKEQDILKVLNK